MIVLVLRVLSNFLESPISNGKEEQNIDAIQTLQLILLLGKERIKYHAKTVFEMLVRLLYETSKALRNNSNELLLKLLEECANSLKYCSKHAAKEFMILCDGMDKVEVNQHFDSVIKSIFDDLLQKENDVNSITNDSFVLCMQKP